MTNAPTDLLGLRSRVQARTGLSAVNDGIVGDTAHAATGGYHEGKTDLQRAGVLGTDYSVRLQRDKNGLTESASAMDIGDDWPTGGRAAWLRFNNLLVAALHSNDPALATVRATNYSPDGTRRLRTDREAGWSTVGTSDVVDIHTHVEWYRDTEGKRAASLDRIDALIAQAISNQPEVTVVLLDSPQKDWLEYSSWGDDAMRFGSDTMRGGPEIGKPHQAMLAIHDIQRKVGALSAPAPVVLTDADRDAIAATVAAQLGGKLDAVLAAVTALGTREATAAQAEADALKP